LEEPVKRSYHAPLRKKQAESTRAQIVEAAARVFSSKGYADTRVEDIAQAAGVAVPTVYKTFGTKVAILVAAIHFVMADSYSDMPIEEHAWWQEQMNATNARDQLRLIARNCRAVYERAGALLEVVRTASTADPAAKDVWRLINRERRRRSELIANSLAGKGALPNIPIASAVDTLLLLSAPELYTLFLERDEETPQGYEDWLGDVLLNALLA